MRKRTLVDLALLVLLLTVAWKVWSGRARGRRDPDSPSSSPENPPPTRIQELMRRSSVDTLPVPPISALSDSPAPQSVLSIPDPAPPALLLVQVRDSGGQVPEGNIFLSTEDGLFRHDVPGGRLALQAEPGRMRLFAGVEDAAGLRISSLADTELLSGETHQLLLEIPDPEVRLPGFRLRPGDLYAEVLQVTPDSAAALAGLQAGDAVLSIDDIPVGGLPGEQLQDLLLGPPAVPLRLRLVLQDEDGTLREVDALISR